MHRQWMMYFTNWQEGLNEAINMKQLFIFIKKEFYHVFRDPKTMLMLFGLPIAQIILFGFALTNEIKNAEILIIDNAQDVSSRAIIKKMASTQTFKISAASVNAQSIEAEFRKGRVKMAVVFPSNFHSDLLHTNTASMQVIGDATDPNTATTLTSFVNTIVQSYQKELLPNAKLPFTIMPEVRMLYNPQLIGATNFVPGVMALVLMLVCVLMTSVSIVREKEKGTMEVLLVSPVNPFLVIISKAIPYFFLSLVNLAVILLMSINMLNMPMNGSVLLLFLESGLLILTSLSLGLLISNVTNSQETAMLISLMGMLIPTLLFTGFMFPIENMPLPLQVISNVVPSKWYYIIVKSIMVKGLGFASIWKETLILSGMTVFLLVLSFKKFKIRLE